MSHTVGISVTCNSNCKDWCPRALHVVMCCFRCTSEAEGEQEITEVRIDRLARNLLTNSDTDV